MRLSTYWTLLKTFSWQELRLHPWRHAMAVLAVMLGVGLALSVQLINASALSDVSKEQHNDGKCIFTESVITRR